MSGYDMVSKMASQNEFTHLVEGAMDRLDLLEGVDTIDLVVIEHAEDAFDMALDRQKPATRILSGFGSEPQAVTLRGIQDAGSAL